MLILITAANCSDLPMPIVLIRKKPAKKAPDAAPMVLIKYNWPSLLPTSVKVRMRNFDSNGRVPPMRKVGMIMTRVQRTKRRILKG